MASPQKSPHDGADDNGPAGVSPADAAATIR